MSAEAPTVFVVDDDESGCRAMDHLLRSAGYQVQTFTSPDTFLTRLPGEGQGCIVIEFFMPGMDGLELQQKLTALGRAWPIIFVTGYGDIPTSVRAMKAGAIDFLTKPIGDVELLCAVAQALALDAAERTERTEREELEGRVGMLTPREYEVFCLLAMGLLNKQIAARLGTTVRTIKAHRSRVMAKLEAESLAGLVHLADSLSIREPVKREAIVSMPLRGPRLVRWELPRQSGVPISLSSVRRTDPRPGASAWGVSRSAS